MFNEVFGDVVFEYKGTASFKGKSKILNKQATEEKAVKQKVAFYFKERLMS